jgi:tmRNA-binding protein
MCLIGATLCREKFNLIAMFASGKMDMIYFCLAMFITNFVSGQSSNCNSNATKRLIFHQFQVTTDGREIEKEE